MTTSLSALEEQISAEDTECGPPSHDDATQRATLRPSKKHQTQCKSRMHREQRRKRSNTLLKGK